MIIKIVHLMMLTKVIIIVIITFDAVYKIVHCIFDIFNLTIRYSKQLESILLN